MSKYKETLILFGGCGAYIPRIKRRENFNSVQIFDPKSGIWTNCSELTSMSLNLYNESAPIRRMRHASDVYGSYLLIHGGLSGEENLVLGDFALYDLE